MKTLIDNKTYYDNFAKNYENERNKGYHKMIDDIEISILRKYLKENDSVLEVGCGTGLILSKVVKFVVNGIGIDISENMLKIAKNKGLNVFYGNGEEIPFSDNQFDVVYSFKVLPHIKNIENVLNEIKRVTKPNGIILLEFYNKYSMRTLIKFIKKPQKISENINDTLVFTRFDSLFDIKKILPKEFKIIATNGVRVISPFYFVYKIPLIKTIFHKLEQKLSGSLLKYLGGFFIVAVKNEK